MNEIAASQIPDVGQPSLKAIFGVAICDMDRETALQCLLAAIAKRQHVKLAFCNAHTANLAWGDADLRQLLAHFMVFADGIGIDIAAKILHGAPFATNLNGTDFIPALLQAEPKSLTIALYGAAPGVADRAAAAILALAPQHRIAALCDGFADTATISAFLTGLQQNPADILLVALGNPRQERWISEHIDTSHATLAIGVGALFDFLAAEVPRAPPWLRQMRLEWLYRLGLEPRRLFRRYVLGNPLFLLRVALVKLSLRRF